MGVRHFNHTNLSDQDLAFAALLKFGVTNLTHFTDCFFSMAVKPLEEWHRPAKNISMSLRKDQLIGLTKTVHTKNGCEQSGMSLHPQNEMSYLFIFILWTFTSFAFKCGHTSLLFRYGTHKFFSQLWLCCFLISFWLQGVRHSSLQDTSHQKWVWTVSTGNLFPYQNLTYLYNYLFYYFLFIEILLYFYIFIFFFFLYSH